MAGHLQQLVMNVLVELLTSALVARRIIISQKRVIQYHMELVKLKSPEVHSSILFTLTLKISGQLILRTFKIEQENLGITMNLINYKMLSRKLMKWLHHSIRLKSQSS
jgi:hypothetical protein